MVARLGQRLSENVMTLLCHSDEFGRMVVGKVHAEQFEGDLYQLIAQRALAYWEEQGQAPKLHIADLFADILQSDDRRASALREIILSMAQLFDGINAQWVVQQINRFVQVHAATAAILQAARLIQDHPDGSRVDEVIALMSEVGRVRDESFSLGSRMTEYQKVIVREVADVEFDTGIAVLDQRHIVPFRGGLFTLLGSTRAGKSWFLVGLAKRAVLRGQRVLIVTLELSEVEFMTRMYQALFSLPKRKADDLMLTTMHWDERTAVPQHEPDYLRHEPVNGDLALDIPNIGYVLRRNVAQWDDALHHVIVKEFPERGITMAKLRNYLDSLEALEGFVPDLLLVDYPGKFQLDVRNYRLELGHVYSELRGLLRERNMAGGVVHQVSREGAKARVVAATHASEDWSIIQTSDIVVSLSCTDEERKHGTARLWVDKARHEQDGFGVMITQGYAIGQFCNGSAPLSLSYDEYRARYLIEEAEREQQQRANGRLHDHRQTRHPGLSRPRPR